MGRVHTCHSGYRKAPQTPAVLGGASVFLSGWPADDPVIPICVMNKSHDEHGAGEPFFLAKNWNDRRRGGGFFFFKVSAHNPYLEASWSVAMVTICGWRHLTSSKGDTSGVSDAVSKVGGGSGPSDDTLCCLGFCSLGWSSSEPSSSSCDATRAGTRAHAHTPLIACTIKKRS